MRTSMNAKWVRQAAIVAALLFPFRAYCADDPNAAIPKPDIKIGDRWTDRIVDNRTKQEKQKFETVVTFAGPDLVILVSTDLSSKREYDSHFTPEWNAITLGSGEVYKEPRIFFKFPLRIGQSFETVYERVASKDSGMRFKNDATVKVLGWEETTVPAGKFRALKVEVQGTFQRLDARGSGWMKHTYWYVPQVKRWVKRTFENGIPQPWDNIGIELVDFQVK